MGYIRRERIAPGTDAQTRPFLATVHRGMSEMGVLSVAEAAQLLRIQYADLPELTLTAWQAQQLCKLSLEVCDAALRTLLDSGFLRQTADGRYTRPGSSFRFST